MSRSRSRDIFPAAMISRPPVPAPGARQSLAAALLASLLGLLVGGSAFAQEPVDAKRAERPPKDGGEVVQGVGSASAVAQPPAVPFRRWSGELGVSGVSDSDFRRDEDELDREGVALKTTVRYQNRESRPTLRVEYAGSLRRVKSFEKPIRERVSHKLQTSYEWRFDDRWSLETVGIVFLGIVTTEASLADDWILMPRLIFRPSGKHRYRLFAGYRLREYTDGPDSEADSPVAGIDYRFLVRRGEYWEIGYKYEDNEADLARLDFLRSTLSTYYTIPVGTGDRVRLGLSFREEIYRNRVVPGNPGGELEDEKWVLSGLWTHEFHDAVVLQLGYNFRTRQSNDPGRDFEANRLTAAVKYLW